MKVNVFAGLILKANEESATQILNYAKTMKAREDRAKAPTTGSQAGETAQSNPRNW